ncbi:MAG: hypothetical protein ACK5RS_03420, partial [Acidobacteriota bacterium]
MKMSTTRLTAKTVILAMALLAIPGFAALTMAQEDQPRPVAYTTAPKLVIAKIRSGEADVYD